MKLVAVAWCAVLAACACKGGSQSPTGPGSGTGSGSNTGGDPALCDGQRAHLESLYQAEAERTKATPSEVADNVAMVMAECKAAPAKIVACVQRATAVAVIERDCLPALDDQGSEGDRFLRK